MPIDAARAGKATGVGGTSVPVNTISLARSDNPPRASAPVRVFRADDEPVLEEIAGDQAGNAQAAR